MSPILSHIARQKKVRFFFEDVPKSARILEIGSGDNWLGCELKRRGWTHYTGLDICPPADVVGDIRDWKRLGLRAESFDIIVAFELVEHLDCYGDIFRLLKDDGSLFLTSPRPGFDWVCKILETLHLTQTRSSPHDFLIDFRTVPYFKALRLKYVGLVSQWGVFKKSSGAFSDSGDRTSVADAE